jgi:hypothetical protein
LGGRPHLAVSSVGEQETAKTKNNKTNPFPCN